MLARAQRLRAHRCATRRMAAFDDVLAGCTWADGAEGNVADRLLGSMWTGEERPSGTLPAPCEKQRAQNALPLCAGALIV